MRLLVTGAGGFTGRHLIASLTRRGAEVVALQANLTDRAAVAREVQVARPTHVAHLAAISAVTHSDQLAFYQVNLFGTLNLLDALASLPETPQNVLLASSANVYGNARVTPIDESIGPAPVNHYAMSKLAMEHLAATYADRLSLVVTRPFNYTGVGHDQRFVIPKIVDHFRRCAPRIELGSLEVEREYNDVRTVCDIYLRLLVRGVAGETYNVCSGRAIALTRVLDALRRISGHEIEVAVNPAFIRPNEIRTLSGCDEKLRQCVGEVDWPTLDETLSWMLHEAT